MKPLELPRTPSSPGPRIDRRDFLASLVVFLVALPLCMGIALASGAPPAAGLMTGIIGGLVVGFLAGSPLQVSGPAAGLSVIVYELIRTHGFEALGWVVLVAGGIQLLAGISGLAQWFRAVSPAVIHGMLAGIGVLIFGSQFHVMVDDAPRDSGLANLFAIPEAVYKGFFPMDNSPHFQAAMIGLLALMVLVGWRPLAPGRLKAVPAPLVAVTAATLVAWAFDLGLKRVALPDDFLDAIALPGLSTLGEIGWLLLLGEGLALAFVASAETLLCATAVDKLHDGPRTRYDRELTAQGVGNLICGFVGALPMTGVIVRSSANVEAGAKTRASAILHGAWLLIFCVAMPFVLIRIPTAALAAVLVFTGYKLVNIAAVRELARWGRSEVAIYAVTLIGIVSFDLLTGVVAGIALSVAKILYSVSHLEVELIEKADQRSDLHLRGAATIMRLPRLASTLERVPPSSELHVHMDELDYIDHACIDLLMNWEKQHEASGGRLSIDWHDLEGRFRSRGEALRNGAADHAA